LELSDEVEWWEYGADAECGGGLAAAFQAVADIPLQGLEETVSRMRIEDNWEGVEYFFRGSCKFNGSALTLAIHRGDLIGKTGWSKRFCIRW
jgi:hypothetical protein